MSVTFFPASLKLQSLFSVVRFLLSLFLTNNKLYYKKFIWGTIWNKSVESTSHVVKQSPNSQCHIKTAVQLWDLLQIGPTDREHEITSKNNSALKELTRHHRNHHCRSVMSNFCCIKWKQLHSSQLCKTERMKFTFIDRCIFA
jgi:hypothetical protein